MNYKTLGPFEIPLCKGKFKTKIDKEDIVEFWDSVDENIPEGCGIYIFTITTEKREKVWYVGRTKKEFIGECFTRHKLNHYHTALKMNRGTPMMYFVVRMKTKNVKSRRSEAKADRGYPEMNFVEQYFIEKGFKQNENIRNKQGTGNVENLVIEGFYNSKDRRSTPTKRLFKLLSEE